MPTTRRIKRRKATRGGGRYMGPAAEMRAAVKARRDAAHAEEEAGFAAAAREAPMPGSPWVVAAAREWAAEAAEAAAKNKSKSKSASSRKK